MPPTTDIALALVHRAGQWLVSLRHSDAHLGGLWEFPGGKLLPGESPGEGALRELIEECGVNAVTQHELPAIIQSYDDRTLRLIPIVCSYAGGEARPHASRACRWVTPRELRDLPMPPANRPLVDWINSVAHRDERNE